MIACVIYVCCKLLGEVLQIDPLTYHSPRVATQFSDWGHIKNHNSRKHGGYPLVSSKMAGWKISYKWKSQAGVKDFPAGHVWLPEANSWLYHVTWLVNRLIKLLHPPVIQSWEVTNIIYTIFLWQISKRRLSYYVYYVYIYICIYCIHHKYLQ